MHALYDLWISYVVEGLIIHVKFSSQSVCVVSKLVGQSDFQVYKFVLPDTFSPGISSYLFRVVVFPCLGQREVNDENKKIKPGSSWSIQEVRPKIKGNIKI